MAGFGMIIGGAMSGWSDARLDEIKAEREARLQELEAQRQDKRLADERQFRSREAELGRNFEAGQTEKSQSFQGSQADKQRSFEAGQGEIDRSYRAGETQKERDFRLNEAEKARQASGDLVTGDNGTSYSRVGSKVSQITDDQGNPVKLATAGTAAAKPAEVSTAEWLVQQGVAPDAATAWKMVRSARSDPDKSRASIYKAWLDALTKGQLGTPDAGDLEKQAREATEKTLQYLNEEPGADGGAGQTSGGASNVIPSDPAKRDIGKTYTNKNGQRAIWTGKGWQLVQ